MDSVTKIEIVLENCDCITLDPKEVEYLTFDDITIDISSISRYKPVVNAKSFIMKLNEKANRKYDSIFEDSFANHDYDVFNRLHNTGDITQIHLTDIKGEEQMFFINWEGEQPYINVGQFSVKGKDQLLVGANQDKFKDIIEYFEAEEAYYANQN